MNKFGRKNISEETISKALQMVVEGYSYSLIAKEIGVSKGLVGRWVKKAKVIPNTRIKKKTKQFNRSVIHTNQDWSKVKMYTEEELKAARQQGAEENSNKNWYFDGDELVITKGKWVVDRYKKHNQLTNQSE